MDSPVVIGPAGLEEILAHAAAVDRPVHDAERRAVEHRPLHRLRRGERLAVLTGRRQVEFPRLRMERCLLAGRDPAAFPVGRFEEAKRERRRLAPGRLAAVAIPGHHLPTHPVAARQRFSGIGDPERLARVDPAGIPAIGHAGLEQRRFARRENAIGRLPLTAVGVGGGHDPGEPRLAAADALRFLQPLALECHQRDAPCSIAAHGRHQRRADGLDRHTGRRRDPRPERAIGSPLVPHADRALGGRIAALGPVEVAEHRGDPRRGEARRCR